MAQESPTTDVIDVTTQEQQKEGALTLNDGLTVNKGIVANPDVGEDAVTANGPVRCTTLISGDMAFTDPCCVLCEEQFYIVEMIVLFVIKIKRMPSSMTTTVPVHYRCAKKRRKVKRWLKKQL